jgi:hypothetical protein
MGDRYNKFEDSMFFLKRLFHIFYIAKLSFSWASIIFTHLPPHILCNHPTGIVSNQLKISMTYHLTIVGPTQLIQKYFWKFWNYGSWPPWMAALMKSTYIAKNQQNSLNIMHRYTPVESKILLVNSRRHTFY